MSKDIASKLDEDDIAHTTLHTKVYYQKVWERVEDINDPIEFRKELEKIGDELSKGTFPYK